MKNLKTWGLIALLFLLIACGGDDRGGDTYDIEANGIPQFVKSDFTQLEKITEISKFRSGAGHGYSDKFESCRSMKHYYAPDSNYKENNEIEIYSPVEGVIHSIINEGHGESRGLNNKQIRIKSDTYPAFVFVIFHTDLIDSNITVGKTVQAGELIGHARMYYPNLDEYAHDFDIAVWVNTSSGTRYLSYFDTMSDTLFNNYIARGAFLRQDFIISREERDNNPLVCNEEQFIDGGTLENWVKLSLSSATITSFY